MKYGHYKNRLDEKSNDRRSKYFSFTMNNDEKQYVKLWFNKYIEWPENLKVKSEIQIDTKKGTYVK